jgi:hypothetical protein
MKAAFNRGREPRLSFYRDKSGLEVDLIREVRRRPFAVEVKAAATFVPEMMRSLHGFRELLPDMAGAAVIHSGEGGREVEGEAAEMGGRVRSAAGWGARGISGPGGGWGGG